MKSFKQFIIEGGNVVIGTEEAERIDLNKYDRDWITPKIDKTLRAISKQFERVSGQPLWSEELLDSKEFLSGSAFHFFNKAIATPEFIKHKSTVGDIDTQIDANLKDDVERFLNTIKGKKLGDATFIGFKKSVGQLITLWKFADPGINIQIDLEFVDFKEGKPTEWSQFSHSSTWEDMQAGVKGAFAKFLMRALTTRSLKEIVLLKGKTEKPVKMMSTDMAFSVANGLRVKIEPVMDGKKQREMDGLPVYKEIPVAASTYINDMATIFRLQFGKEPTPSELKDLNSFVGGASLVKKYFDKKGQAVLLEGFVMSIFGKSAQPMYRGNPELDKKEKMVALEKLESILGIKYNRSSLKKMQNDFYRNYK